MGVREGDGAEAARSRTAWIEASSTRVTQSHITLPAGVPRQRSAHWPMATGQGLRRDLHDARLDERQHVRAPRRAQFVKGGPLLAVPADVLALVKADREHADGGASLGAY